jgi:hypothetical protein
MSNESCPFSRRGHLFCIAAGSRSAAVTWVPALTSMLVRMRVQAVECRAGTLLALTRLHDMHSSDCVRACVSFSVILLSIMRHVKKPFIFEIPHSSFLISGYAPKHHYLVPVLYPYQVAARAD